MGATSPRRGGLRVAVVGAGIYGATTAIRLARQGHRTHLFDPLGVLAAASAINQYRIHAGYHYPRSPETIYEVQEARTEFMDAFRPAIVSGSTHYYAIPREGSRTAPDDYERIMAEHRLALRPCRPDWMNFDFIDRCYEVDEATYDPDVLRSLLEGMIREEGVVFHEAAYDPARREDFDYVVFATYALGPSRAHFDIAKYQVAEKVLIELPPALRQVALVVVDGPFTAFDPYGSTVRSMFGSAKHTNHWTTTEFGEPIPPEYLELLNQREFRPWAKTRFDEMRDSCVLSVPAAAEAKYLGSKVTLRVVEDDPLGDRRILHVREGAPGELHIFSGKVVSAVKAARLVCERIAASHG